MRFRSLYPYNGDARQHQLSFGAGAIIEVNDSNHAGGWMFGRLETVPEQKGWFPASYVEPIVPSVALPCPPSMPAPALPSTAVVSKFDGDDDNDGGFGGGAMGGEWNDTRAGVETVTVQPPSTNRSWCSDNNQKSNKSSFKDRMKEGFSRISQTAPRSQHQQQQQQPKKPAQNSHNTNGTVTTFEPGGGGGILPGRKTETTTTTTNKGLFGGTETVTTSVTSRSGGFNPWLGGKTTTTTVQRRDAFGNVTSQEKQTKSGGGFGIIPLGPIGLAACGAIAAKNALDHQFDKRRSQQQQQQQR